jgi:catechol 2,3-dioxygenase-like lactoylglutathione lyase family enzyme
MMVLKPHVSLNVSNVDASAKFYEQVFGVKQEAPRSGVNASHFGVQVASTEDVAIAWTRFKEAGLKTFTEKDTSCCYALQDKVWVEDPDGNMWEVFVVKGDTEEMHGDPPKLSAACCAPSSLPAHDEPVQLGKKSGCC